MSARGGTPGIDRPLRAFHLPVNVASVMSGNVAGLRALGVEARGMAVGTLPVLDDAGIDVIDIQAKPGTPRWLRKRAVITNAFLEGLAWADVVHWYFDAHVLPFSLDIALVGARRIPAVIQLLGSDARDPAIEMADNPWYARAWDNGYEYRGYESSERSGRLQRTCADAGFWFAPNTGLVQYVRPEYRDRITTVERPVALDAIVPRQGGGSPSRPLVIHAPTAPVCKGTEYVREAVRALQAEGLDFEFRLLENVRHAAAQDMLASADIVIDQVVLGDYGVLSIEAMAHGKPVIAWVKPALAGLYPTDLPVVSADPDGVRGALRTLLADAGLRARLGSEGRRYVERVHAPKAVAGRLLEAYDNARRLRAGSGHDGRPRD